MARKVSGGRDAAALRRSRNDHAVAAANEIARMILGGFTTEDVNLANLVREYESLLGRGAVVPRDLRSLVERLTEKARAAQCVEDRRDCPLGGGRRPGAVAKKTPAKKAARKIVAKRAPAKKAARKVAA
ncbi:hypothetical protein [Ramlibacter sp.]